jgi:hypothetical protein
MPTATGGGAGAGEQGGVSLGAGGVGLMVLKPAVRGPARARPRLSGAALVAYSAMACTDWWRDNYRIGAMSRVEL